MKQCIVISTILIFFLCSSLAAQLNKDTIFKTGCENFNSKKYDLAIEKFTFFLRNFPKDKNIAYVYYLLGESYYAKHEYEKAIKIFNKALKNFQPTDTLIRKINFTLAYSYLSNDETDKAIDEFAHIASNYPFTSEGLLAQLKIGDCFYDEQNFKKASDVYLKAYEKIIQNKNMFTPKIGDRLASSYFRAGEFNKSIKIYEEIITKYPEYEEIASIKINLALVHFFMRNFEKARNILNEVVSVNLTNQWLYAEAYYWLGRIAYDEELYTEATAHFKKVLSYFPEYKNDLIYNAIYGIAKIDFKTKKEAQAEALLNYLIQIPPDRNIVPSAYCALAELYERQGKNVKANSIYSKIIEISSTINSSAHSHYIWEERLFPTVDKYLELNRKSLDADHVASTLYVTAEAYQKIGYLENAEKIYLEITRKFPQNAFSLEAWIKLCSIYQLQNEKEKIKKIIFFIERYYPDIGYLEKSKLILAKTYYNSLNFDSAIILADEIIKKDKNSDVTINANYLAGKVCLNKNQTTMALFYFQNIIKSSDNSVWAAKALYEIGWIYIKEKKYESAIANFKKIQENYIYFKAENVASILADLFYLNKKFKEAEAQYIVLIEKSTNDLIKNRSLFWLGWTYYMEKNYKNTKEIFDLYLDKNPISNNKILLYFIISECYRAMGNFTDASNIYIKITNDYSETKYSSLAQKSFELAFSQNTKDIFEFFPKQKIIYEETYESEKNHTRISPNFIFSDFPFSFNEWFLQKFRIPQIYKIYHDAKPNLKKGDEITVTIKGTPNKEAYFDIGTFKKHIPMEELSIGVYRGNYIIKTEDNIEKAKITVYLKDFNNTISYLESKIKFNIKNQKIYQSNPINLEIKVIEIDNIPENLVRPATDLNVYVLPNGSIEYIDIIKTSGNSILDQISIDKIKSEKYNQINIDTPDQALRVFNIRTVFVRKN